MSIFYSPKLKYVKLSSQHEGLPIKFNGTIVKIVMHFYIEPESAQAFRIYKEVTGSSQNIINFAESNQHATQTLYKTVYIDGCWDVTSDCVFSVSVPLGALYMEIWYLDTNASRNNQIKNMYESRK